MEWQQVTVITTTAFSDTVSFLLMEEGSEGVAIKDNNDVMDIIKHHNWDYVDNSLVENAKNVERVLVSGFFPTNYTATELMKKLNEYKSFAEYECGSLEILTSVIDSKDWENEWRKYYHPIEIGNVAIVPKWYNYNNEKNLATVKIEPGMAFGTGSHETTSMCVRLLQDISLENKIVADVGCGSGILGITALKLNAKKCVFVDIDEQAIKATKDNIALNQIAENRIKVSQGNLLNANKEKFDVVVANITADILILLKDELKKSLKDDGLLIISGLINARAIEVKNIYLADYNVIKNIVDGEWQAFLFSKKK